MNRLFLIILILTSINSFGQPPVWIDSVAKHSVPKDKLLSFPEKLNINRKIAFMSFVERTMLIKKVILKEITTVDSLVKVVNGDSSFFKFNGEYVKAYPEFQADHNVLVLEYLNEYSREGFDTEFNISVDSFPDLKILKSKNLLVELKQSSVILAMEVDPFSKPEMTENYAKHLLGLIHETLSTFPNKLDSFSYENYISFENSKGLNSLSRKINFRIIFLKTCYAKL